MEIVLGGYMADLYLRNDMRLLYLFKQIDVGRGQYKHKKDINELFNSNQLILSDMYIDDNSNRKPLGADIISSLEKAKAGLTSDGDFIEEYYTDEELDREIYDVIIKVISNSIPNITINDYQDRHICYKPEYKNLLIDYFFYWDVDSGYIDVSDITDEFLSNLVSFSMASLTKRNRNINSAKSIDQVYREKKEITDNILKNTKQAIKLSTISEIFIDDKVSVDTFEFVKACLNNTHSFMKNLDSIKTQEYMNESSFYLKNINPDVDLYNYKFAVIDDYLKYSFILSSIPLYEWVVSDSQFDNNEQEQIKDLLILISLLPTELGIDIINYLMKHKSQLSTLLIHFQDNYLFLIQLIFVFFPKLYELIELRYNDLWNDDILTSNKLIAYWDKKDFNNIGGSINDVVDDKLDKYISSILKPVSVINYLKLILFKWRRKSNHIIGEFDLLPIESVVVDIKDELIKYTFINFISDVLEEEIVASSFRLSADILLSIASAILYSKKCGNTIVIPDKYVDSYVKYYIENYYIRYNKPYLIDRIESLNKFIDSSKKVLCDGFKGTLKVISALEIAIISDDDLESVERHLKKMYSDYIYELINNIEPSNSLNDDKTIIEDWFCHVYFDKKEILEDLNKFLKGVQELVEKNKHAVIEEPSHLIKLLKKIDDCINKCVPTDIFDAPKDPQPNTRKVQSVYFYLRSYLVRSIMSS